jgi:hypothetical protein
LKDAKATKAVAKKPLKDAKATKAVAKKPLKDAKVAKAVAKKPLKDAKVAKKSKTQIYRGSGCSGFFCFSEGKVEVYPPQPVAPQPVAQQPVAQQPVAPQPVAQQPVAPQPVAQQPVAPQPVAQQPVAPQPDNRINTSLSERNINMFLIKNEYEVKEGNGCNPYNFKLTKKVGDKQIYTTTININSNTYEIVIKIMKYKIYNLLEKNIMIAIRDQIISKNNSKHFLLIYFYSLCHNGNYLELLTYNEPVENSLRDLIIKDYGRNLLDDDTFHNLLIQSLLSIGSYHNLTGYVHMDTHTGNFLYAENSEHNPEGYYQYSFGDETYYLKSCGYNVMIYDFGYSNKIDIPVDKIKRFELLYDNDNYEVARSYIVKGGLYKITKQDDSYNIYEPDDDLNLTVKKGKSYGTNKDNIFTYSDILYIYNMFVDIVNNVNYYRIKILIDDYGIFLQDLRVLFEGDKDVVENTGRLMTIDTIKDEIEKIKGYYDYLKTPSTITDAQFYGYAKDIFKRVLDICITHFSKHFPKIFSKKETKSMLSTLFGKQKPTPQTILNNSPYLLYLQNKITVEEPTIT